MNGQAKTQEPSGCVQSVIVPTGTEKRKFIIYKVTNRVNGKVYIGQTAFTLEVRKSHHIHSSKRMSPHYFHRAIRKYGQDAFTWEIICSCFSKDEADAKERELIKFFGSKVPSGYNMTDGGEGTIGFSLSEESRDKISKKLTGYKHSDETRAIMSKARTGRKLSDETRAKLSARMKGTHMSNETKAKISKGLMGNKPWNVGKPVSEETKARISKALTGKTGTFLGRKHTAESRAKITAAQTGKKRGPHSADHKEKIRNALRGRTISEEQKSQISKTLVKMWAGRKQNTPLSKTA
jgi:group I intron endonuclease